jgi:hypothetical protein
LCAIWEHPKRERLKTNCLLSISALIILSCTNRRKLVEGEMHILPKGYTGQVSIIFNQPEGEQPETFNGMRIYRIPNGGVLKTRFKFEAGYFPCTLLHYYCVKGGDTTSIGELVLTPKDSLKGDVIYMHSRHVSGDTLRYWVGDGKTAR